MGWDVCSETGTKAAPVQLEVFPALALLVETLGAGRALLRCESPRHCPLPHCTTHLICGQVLIHSYPQDSPRAWPASGGSLWRRGRGLKPRLCEGLERTPGLRLN